MHEQACVVDDKRAAQFVDAPVALAKAVFGQKVPFKFIEICNSFEYVIQAFVYLRI
jgi:hypothetical protein